MKEPKQVAFWPDEETREFLEWLKEDEHRPSIANTLTRLLETHPERERFRAFKAAEIAALPVEATEDPS